MAQQESDLPKELAALAGADYVELEQLSRDNEAEIKKLYGIGPNANISQL
ncbi:MAG TPA: hypothetical protein VKU38_13320 [Ktedonobacteraceae bacterium]|nr:hypothetical protein [Ktedonobacteraceae bacterium]